MVFDGFEALEENIPEVPFLSKFKNDHKLPEF